MRRILDAGLRPLALCTLVVAATHSGVGHAAIYKVGAGRGCTHSTVQAAVDAAELNAGTDTIRIARNQNYLAQDIRIHGQQVELQGGYANCASTLPDAARTVLSGAGGAVRPVVSVYGAPMITVDTVVTLTNIEIVSGEQSGIEYSNAYRGNLVLNNVHVVQNASTTVGGGVRFYGHDSAGWTDSTLFIGDDTLIEGNSAGRGGGLYCHRGRVSFYGKRSRVSNNAASGDGGGAYFDQCSVSVSSPGGFPYFGAFAINRAGGNGGGFVAGNGTSVTMYPAAGVPTMVNANVASGIGGGIMIDGRSDVFGSGVIIENNVARSGGGGVAVVDTGRGSMLWIDGAFQPCDAALGCNRISNNLARSESGANQHGGAVLVSVSDAEQGTPSRVLLEGVTVDGNQGATIVRGQSLHGRSARLSFRDSVFSGNIASTDLIQNMSYFYAPPFNLDNSSELTRSTIAQNTIGGAVLRTTPDFRMRSSIIWQPGRRSVEPLSATFAPGTIDEMLVNDASTFPAAPRVIVADPKFINAAAGDFHLRMDSPALDISPSGFTGDVDRDGRPRSVDLPSVPNTLGPTDLGAYERQVDTTGVIGGG